MNLAGSQRSAFPVIPCDEGVEFIGEVSRPNGDLPFKPTTPTHPATWGTGAFVFVLFVLGLIESASGGQACSRLVVVWGAVGSGLFVGVGVWIRRKRNAARVWNDWRAGRFRIQNPLRFTAFAYCSGGLFVASIVLLGIVLGIAHRSAGGLICLLIVFLPLGFFVWPTMGPLWKQWRTWPKLIDQGGISRSDGKRYQWNELTKVRIRKSGSIFDFRFGEEKIVVHAKEVNLGAGHERWLRWLTLGLISPESKPLTVAIRDDRAPSLESKNLVRFMHLFLSPFTSVEERDSDDSVAGNSQSGDEVDLTIQESDTYAIQRSDTAPEEATTIESTRTLISGRFEVRSSALLKTAQGAGVVCSAILILCGLATYLGMAPTSTIVVASAVGVAVVGLLGTLLCGLGVKTRLSLKKSALKSGSSR